MKKKKKRIKKPKVITYPTQLFREDYFKCPIWFADALEFDFRNMDPDKKPNIKKCTEILPKGSLVVLPSFVWHRVCPVKSGERNSLVIWNLGYPFQ